MVIIEKFLNDPNAIIKYVIPFFFDKALGYFFLEHHYPLHNVRKSATAVSGSLYCRICVGSK